MTQERSPMATVLDDVPTAPVPALGGGWTLRPAAAHAYAAARDSGPVILLGIHRVRHHPLRACYPFGAHDLVVEFRNPVADPAPDLLRELVPALFGSTPNCRRIIAAPDEDDARTQRALEAGGFSRVAEADLPAGSVVLYAAERPEIARLSTALDDMPH
jgi:hypothetical protein